MLIWLAREWREALRQGPGPFLWPPLAAAAALWALPPAWGAGALLLVAAAAALLGTARRLWRERHTGSLQRLALAPVHPGALLGARLLARAAVLALQFLPVGALAAWRATPGQGAAVLGALAGTLLGGTAAGAAIGLWARRWAPLHGTAVLAVAAIWLAALPRPPAVAPDPGGPALAAGLAWLGGPALLLVVGAGAMGLAAWLAPRLLGRD